MSTQTKPATFYRDINAVECGDDDLGDLRPGTYAVIATGDEISVEFVGLADADEAADLIRWDWGHRHEVVEQGQDVMWVARYSLCYRDGTATDGRPVMVVMT